MPNTREKLIELLDDTVADCMPSECIDEIADHLIANGVTVQKWIPVTERLPGNTELVLICSKIGNQYVAQHYNGHFYSDGKHISTSHWMPLPVRLEN